MSLMERMKRSGPRIDPWGTPGEDWSWTGYVTSYFDRLGATGEI